MTDTSESQSTTVYYDGACPLCRREISVYRKMRGTSHVVWADVSDTSVGLPDTLDRDDALRRFHVRDDKGQLHSGGRAFAVLWRSIPGLRVPGRLFLLPGFSTLLEVAYRGFLKIRPKIQTIVKRAVPSSGTSP